MNLFHITVLFLLQYFVSHSEGKIRLEYLDFYEQNHQITTRDDPEYNYPLGPGDEEVDIVWQCRKSIKLEIRYFELDGQNGDFLMISDVPLDVDKLGDDYESLTSTSPEFIDSILVSNGLLLSWGVNQSIQVHSDHGSFIYFHAQAPNATGERSNLFRGFDIMVVDFDELRATTPRPTPEPEVTTPSPGTEIYFSVFLGCVAPQQFAEEKDAFKEVLAEMANKYCNETQKCDDICGEEEDCEPLFKEFTIDEVSIPDRGMFYCDSSWPNFESCVEVRFAIVRTTTYNNTYILTKDKLKDMWTKYSSSLNGTYCPFQPPGAEEFQTWVWVAFILGMILVLSALFWVIWIKKSNEDFNKSHRSSSTRLKTSDEDKTDDITGFSDHSNPFYKFYKRYQRGQGKEDAKYSEMVNELGNIVDSDRPTFRENQLYHRMQGEHDNPGYTTEEVEVEFERPKPNPSANRFSPVDFMNITELDQDTEI